MTADLTQAEAVDRRHLPECLCNIDRLQKALVERNLDGIVSYYTPNVLYLSSFVSAGGDAHHQADGLAAVVIARDRIDEPTIVVRETEAGYFRRQPSWIKDLRVCESPIKQLDIGADPHYIDRFLPKDFVGTPEGVALRTGSTPNIAAGVAKAMSDLGLAKGRVAFDNLRFGLGLQLEGVEVVDGYTLMKHVRSVKTPAEVRLLRQAADTNRRALEATVAGWSPGTTWWEIADEYQRQALAHGGLPRGPYPFVLSNVVGGDPAFLVHAGLDDDFVLQPGTRIMFDAHGSQQEYCWDGGKTWIVGDGASSTDTVINGTANALTEIEAALKPGARIVDLQRAGRLALRKSGVANADNALIFFHSIGLEHGDIEVVGDDGFGGSNWQVEEGMLVASHLYVPGDHDTDRYWLEDVALVGAQSGESIYEWDFYPLV